MTYVIGRIFEFGGWLETEWGTKVALNLNFNWVNAITAIITVDGKI